MSAENVRVVEEIQTALTVQEVVSSLDDEEADARVRRVFMEHAAPDFKTLMVGPDYAPGRAESTGIEGFGQAWQDWTSPFERYEIQVDEMIDAGEQVVSFVTMTARTRTGGAEITAPGAAVWTVVDGRVRRVEFHLERDAALRAAGLDSAPSR